MPFVFYLLVFFSSFSFLSETNEELTVSTNQNWNFKPSSEIISSDEIRFLKDSGLKLRDLKTEQSNLEKIFVSLVKENNEI